MLQEFLRDNRTQLIDRCREKAALRSGPGTNAIRQEHGIPIFLEQLIGRLTASEPREPGALAEMGRSATSHGAELFRSDFTIEQVVHDYGDLCQAIMELAIERNKTIDVGEFQILNQALDNAIADAVSEYSSAASMEITERGLRAESERFAGLAHELRNLIHTATLALAAIKAGNVGLFGATGAVLDRSMVALRALIDRSLAEIREKLPLSPHMEVFALADFIRDVATAAALEARTSECAFTAEPVDPLLTVKADRDLLNAAVGNLLHNAFKFSHKNGDVRLSAHASGSRVLIEVADSCGGLPAGAAERMFSPFVQLGKDRSGLGLGLAIVKRSVQANGGDVSVRDVPTVGCVFTVELPRHAA
jgi:signal transduction histidine kinase